ncbi:MAG: HEAT repeat domain-containing protein, partial [Gemmatimonadota bacterium]|nr:HEAT repeat domain-containing protein [Gemmatimonadota bacterium]
PPVDFPPIDIPPIDVQAMEFALADAQAMKFHLEDLKVDLENLKFEMPMHVEVPADFDTPMPPDLPRAPFATRPRAGWAPQDVADSLYRAAREALNRYEYRRAAQLFRQLRDRYPRSEYAGDAVYWEAFSLYRVGTMDDLRTALRVIESQQARYSKEEIQADAAALATRIRGALAMRGDREAARQVERTAQGNGQTCDPEDISVRVEALSALSQMDGETVVPILRRVLARRDECSAQLRRRALSILGRRGDTAAVATFLSVAKADPDPSVRAEAIGHLARQPGDRVVDALEELLRTSGDERVQRSAVRALAHHESPRARRSLRALIERSDVGEQLRREAIGSFERERSSADDAAYIRSLYGRLESQRLKEAVIHAAGRLGGADNEQWLANLVKNPNEPPQLRAAALGRLGRTTMPISEFSKMYDAATERGIREQVMNVLAYRKEPEATDKLIEIARTGTDPQLRRLAIHYLTRKNDPRTQKLLLEILDK